LKIRYSNVTLTTDGARRWP